MGMPKLLSFIQVGLISTNVVGVKTGVEQTCEIALQTTKMKI